MELRQGLARSEPYLLLGAGVHGGMAPLWTAMNALMQRRLAAGCCRAEPPHPLPLPDRCTALPPCTVSAAPSPLCRRRPRPRCAQVESRTVVAAGALVPPGTVIPSGQVWAGSPAKFIRNLVEGGCCLPFFLLLCSPPAFLRWLLPRAAPQLLRFRSALHALNLPCTPGILACTPAPAAWLCRVPPAAAQHVAPSAAGEPRNPLLSRCPPRRHGNVCSSFSSAWRAWSLTTIFLPSCCCRRGRVCGGVCRHHGAAGGAACGGECQEL